jgi:hypothetical protein
VIPGQVLHAARRVTLRTRGGGNLAVDLPRGRAVQVIALKGDAVILGPGQADADLLRQFGVRKIPRYAATREQIASEFLSPEAWAEVRERERRRLRERWPSLSADQADRILEGEPWVGMTLEQAEEAVGSVVFSRDRREGPRGVEETWRIGRRPRSAELRLFTEGRERGIRSRTFEDYLAAKARAVLRFRDGLLEAVEAP